MLTKKGKYGLKAMVHLAGLAPDALAQAADIAETNSISKKFLDHILTELRHAGLIYSKKGKGGGYALARPAHEINWRDRARPRWSLSSDRLRFGHGVSTLRRLRRPQVLPGPADHGRRARRDCERARSSHPRRNAGALPRRRIGADVSHLGESGVDEGPRPSAVGHGRQIPRSHDAGRRPFEVGCGGRI